MDKWGRIIWSKVESIVGKGEIARYEQFLLFPQCFQKLSNVNVSKWVFMEWRVKIIIHQVWAMLCDKGASMHSRKVSTDVYLGRQSKLTWAQGFRSFNPFLCIQVYTHFNTLKKIASGKHCGKKWNCSKWAISLFFSHNVFYAICILKFFNSHISVVVCSFFEFGTVSKWFIR